MKKIFLLVVVLCTCVCCQSQKQIGIGANGVTLSEDTVCSHDTIVYSLFVVNKGNLPITVDSVRLLANFITTSSFGQTIDTKGIPTTILQPGDSLFFEFKDTVQGMRYIENSNNIIVIWPKVLSTITVDTAHINLQVNVCSTNAVEEEDKDADLIFFDETSSQLFFLTESEVSSAEIYDVNGRLIHGCQAGIKTERVSGLTTGVYFIQARFVDGRSSVFRFVKRE